MLWSRHIGANTFTSDTIVVGQLLLTVPVVEIMQLKETSAKYSLTEDGKILLQRYSEENLTRMQSASKQMFP